MDTTTKHTLRATIKNLLDSMSDADRAAQSQQLRTQITTSDLYQSATTILCYASLPTELSLDPLITQALADHKTVCIPSVDWEIKTMQPVQIESLDNNLQIGRYGLRSPSPDCKPIPDAQITLALIPGLGFDPAGHRLGRGAGFYDRWIEHRRQLDTPVSLVGVCFDEQLVERIPTDPHDQPMDRVVTPTAEYVRTHG